MNIYDYIETLWTSNGSWKVVNQGVAEHWKSFLKNGLDYHPSQLFDLTDDGWQVDSSAYSIDEGDVDEFISCCDELDAKFIKD